jgi:flagellin FlaB
LPIKVRKEKSMYNKLAKAWKNIQRGQRGITGLETAIILIAFVTVAAVLGYSVLSAGIFSAERGKETVYQGLEQAQSSMEIRGSVLALSSANETVDQIQFCVASVLDDEAVDMTNSAGNNVTIINYADDDVHAEDIDWDKALLGTERGTTDMLEADETMLVTVDVPDTATLTAYDSFSIQLVPVKGASITIKRTLPGTINTVTDLH